MDPKQRQIAEERYQVWKDFFEHNAHKTEAFKPLVVDLKVLVGYINYLKGQCSPLRYRVAVVAGIFLGWGLLIVGLLLFNIAH